MSQRKAETCTYILRDCYGGRVEKVGKYLAENGASALRPIASKIGLSMNETKTALQILIKHNLVDFKLDVTKQSVLYSLKLKNVLAVVRYAHYLNVIRSLYDSEAELIVRQILCDGQISLSDIITSVAENLPDRNNCEKRIYEKFVQLVQTHFVQQCPALVTSEKDVIPVFKVNEAQMYNIPPFSSITDEVNAKKQSSEVSGKGRSVTKSDVIYWQINIDRFNEYLRDQAIISAVAKRDPLASEVVRAILRLSEVRSSADASKTVPISFHDILRELPPNLKITQDLLHSLIRLLTDYGDFVQHEGDGGGGQYSVNFHRGFAELCKAHIESAVEQRYRPSSKRIMKILMMGQRLEMAQIEKLAEVDPKEATGLVYRLMGDGFISATELPKSLECVPKSTYFFFHVNVNRVAQLLLERSYQAISNQILVRLRIAADNKRLILKEQRMNAIVAQLDPEEQEEVRQQITPAERAQLEKYNHATFKLLQAEQVLDETIFILETHLDYSISK